MSWLINFQVLNLRQPLVSQIWYGLNRLLEPIYSPIRRILPNLGGIDLAPLVALIAVYALRSSVNNAAHQQRLRRFGGAAASPGGQLLRDILTGECEAMGLRSCLPFFCASEMTE